MRVLCVVAMSVFALGVGTGQVWAAGQEAQVVLPEGAVVGYLNYQQLFVESLRGQELTEQVQAFEQEKLGEINAMNGWHCVE